MSSGSIRTGVLPVLKPPGWTSHDVVARARRWLGQRRIGHTGTLDPGAAGVLLLLVGRATRLAELLQQEDKTYVAEMFLGAATDTQDGYGRVVEAHRDAAVSERRLRNVLDEFVGPSEQIPPMTSAVRQGGRRLYELAHKGIEVARPARPIVVHRLELLRTAPPLKAGGDKASAAGNRRLGYGSRVAFAVDCSKGTYVRTLCHDIGRRLGCGAFMSFLLRTRIGDVDLEHTRTLDEVEREAASGSVRLLPVDLALQHIPAALATAEGARRVVHGQPAKASELVDAPLPAASVHAGRPGAGMLRLYDSSGVLLALMRPDPDIPGRWRPRIVFVNE